MGLLVAVMQSWVATGCFTGPCEGEQKPAPHRASSPGVVQAVVSRKPPLTGVTIQGREPVHLFLLSQHTMTIKNELCRNNTRTSAPSLICINDKQGFLLSIRSSFLRAIPSFTSADCRLMMGSARASLCIKAGATVLVASKGTDGVHGQGN